MSRRLLASYLTLAAIVLLALAIPLAITFERSERRALISDIERDAVTLAAAAADALRANPNATSIPEITAITGGGMLADDERVVVVRATDGVAIIDTSGDHEGGPFATPNRPELGEALNGKRAIDTRHSDTLGGDLLYVAVPVVSDKTILGAVRITFPTATVDARVRRVWIVLGALAIFVLSVAALVGLQFARSIAGPLARLERAAVAAGDGDLTVRAPVGGPAEVRSLATRFNQMVSRLEELVREREAFVADASHQLRTPLAAMRLRLENLEAASTVDDQAGLEAAVAEVDRLNRLVDGLLVLSRPSATDPARDAIEVCALVAERVEMWSALGEENGVAVRSKIDGRVLATASPGRLEQVIDNLIENAIEAMPSGGNVTVSASAHDTHAEIHVMDDGRGMTEQERARAFDRFWRSERNKADGTGLGLAIVRRLVESDAGTISLHEAPGGGLDVKVTYPVPRTW